MGRTCTLKVQLPDSSIREERITLEDQEWKLLLRDRKYARDLEIPGMIDRQEWQAQFKIRWDEREGLTASRSGPTDEQIGLALHRMRPLILKGEPTYFHRVTNVIARKVSDPEIRAGIRRLSALFSGREFQQAVTIKVGNQTVNSEEMLETYLNAIEYHRDQGKAAAVAALEKLLPSDAVRGVMVHLLTDKLIAIRGLEMLIDVLDGKLEGIRL